MLLDEEDIKNVYRYFFNHFGIKGNKVSDKQFLKILRVCWKNHIDMNFDDNPDFEDLEWIRNTDYKYQVLHQLTYISDTKLEQDIRELFECNS